MTSIFTDLAQTVERLNLPLWDHQLLSVQWSVVIAASLVAAVLDIRTRRIPNKLTFPLFFVGMVWATWIGGLVGFFEGIAGCLLLATPFVLLFVFAGGGAGDAKLMGALGAWLGLVNGLLALLAVLLAGVAIGLLYAAEKKRFNEVLNRIKIKAFELLLVARRSSRKGDRTIPNFEQAQMLAMPYGLSIFVGVCTAAIGAMMWRL